MGGNDKLVGGAGSDHLNGGDGNDYLYGGSFHNSSWPEDHDTLIGGAGHDVIDAANRSDMTGGSGHDRFLVNEVQEVGGPNHITDFEAAHDRWYGAWDTIGVYGPDGTASNYFETMIAYNFGYNLAKSFGDMYIDQGYNYVFITDSVNGYFFADTNNNGTTDAAVVLDGLDDLADFNYKNVVNDPAYDYFF